MPHLFKRGRDVAANRRWSFTTRLLVVAVAAIQVPLLAVSVVALRTPDLSKLELFGLLWLSSLVGTAVLLTAVHRRMQPLEVASRRLRGYLYHGVLDVGGPYPNDELGRMLAELDEVCVRLDDARRKAVRAATVDPVSGAVTRRAAEARLAELVRRCRRRDDRLSVALVDLDHFKQVNDELGHAAGDAALREVVTVLGRCVRGVALVARWGGDELLVAVVGDSAEATAGLTRAGRIVAERLTAVLGRRTTISAGVCGLRPHDSWPEAVALADAALYSAKAQGRDLVVDATAPVLQLP